ncbi:MAG: hypothetical protein RL701_1883 [Pseudomonadota bacterium]|jgi:dihydrofolate reductase
MSKLRFKITLSLDGYIAGPDQSVENPLGIGGSRLHEWAFALAAFRKQLGMQGGEVNASTGVLEESVANIGATIMGRNMFGGHAPGQSSVWRADQPWDGWWGKNPPFHHAVFVLTHHPRKTLELEGGTRFVFVTDGIESALEQARQAAGGKDITLAGGAKAAQQYLKRGLVDEMELSLAPLLLGSGERLFESVGSDLHGLKLVRTVATRSVVHLKFVRS